MNKENSTEDRILELENIVKRQSEILQRDQQSIIYLSKYCAALKTELLKSGTIKNEKAFIENINEVPVQYGNFIL